MICNILAVGDVVGDGGLDCLSKHLRQLKRLKGIHFTVVNGENASGMGILPRQARAIFDAGADVITLGNHTWNRLQIADFLEDDRYTLRPANYTNRVPGRGWGVFDGPRGLRIGVMNLIGRCEMDSNLPRRIIVLRNWKRIWCWWISTRRPPAKKGQWPGIWMAGYRRCGGRIPMCLLLTRRFCPRGWGL